MNTPPHDEQSISLPGLALVGMMGVSFAIIAAAIWSWLVSLYGQAIVNAAIVLGLVALALLVGFLAGQERKGR